MQMDRSIPYPRPDYGDPDLITKEMVNGTFGLAVLDDVKHFRPVMDRYNVTQEKLIQLSTTSGKTMPYNLDISETDPTYYGVNEMAWLPAKIKDMKPEPEEVYFPAKYYAHVEWQGLNAREIPGITPDKNDVFMIYYPYYDRDMAGILGFVMRTDSDHNIVGGAAAFFNLASDSLVMLAATPANFDPDRWQYIGYVKGYFILNDYGSKFISFGLDGSFRAADLGDSGFAPLGDEGCFAVGASIYRGDFSLEAIDDSDPNYSPVSITAFDPGIVAGMRKYQFGMKIGDSYFFNAAGGGSTKVWKTRHGKWKAVHIDGDIWKYQVMLRFDYATDNWTNEPLKTLKYNMRAHGIFVKNHFPPGGRDTQFKSSDMHGDFCASGGKVYHTFDFKKWEEVTGDGANYLFGCYDRIWIKGRSDGIVGMMPYSLELKNYSDFDGSQKAALQFRGFVFRG